MSLPSLPREVLDDIFSDLDWSDIKNVRLQHRRLAEIGLEYFPREITLPTSDWSLERVEKLLSLEAVCKNVRCVSICCYVISPLPDPCGSDSTTIAIFRTAIEEMLNRQYKLLQHGTYFTAIKAILQKLSRLESVVVPSDPRHPYNIVWTYAMDNQLSGKYDPKLHRLETILIPGNLHRMDDTTLA